MSSSVVPPAFQEADRCDVCMCSFNTFRRRHHCRCCGRTLCHDHSSDQMALPQFGIYTNVRVCSDCYNNSSRPGKDDPPASASAIDDTSDKFSKLNVGMTIDSKSDLISKSAAVVTDCYCGMPLCICEASVPDTVIPVQVFLNSGSTVQLNSRPKKNISIMQTSNSNPTNIQSSSNAKPSVFFSLGQANVTGTNKPDSHYEANGEGLREAIKNNDATAVKKLLNEGVDANYCDKQGLTLLHLDMEVGRKIEIGLMFDGLYRLPVRVATTFSTAVQQNKSNAQMIQKQHECLGLLSLIVLKLLLFSWTMGPVWTTRMHKVKLRLIALQRCYSTKFDRRCKKVHDSSSLQYVINEVEERR